MRLSLGILIIIGTVLLFTKFPEIVYGRLSLEFLNLGHFFLFFSFSFYWLYFFILKKQKKLSVHLFVATSAILSLVSELIQLTMPSRTFSIDDIAKDMMGSGYALLLYFLLKRKVSIFRFTIVTVLLTTILSHRLIPLAIEEWRIQKKFPMLASFEAPYELSRWSYVNVSITDAMASEGKNSLKVTVEKDSKYSGAGFKHFPKNWYQYKTLHADIYVDKPTLLTMRVNDHAHLKNNRYEDRFNRHLKLTSGWNHVTIPLEKIKTSPSTRVMDMTNIFSIGIFSTAPHQVTEFYIDNLFLK